jgi:hypothetical protein
MAGNFWLNTDQETFVDFVIEIIRRSDPPSSCEKREVRYRGRVLEPVSGLGDVAIAAEEDRRMLGPEAGKSAERRPLGRQVKQGLHQFDRGRLRQSHGSQDERGGAADKNVAR